MTEILADLSELDFQAYVDGRLDVVRRAEVEAFMAEHPEEALRLASLRAHTLGLQALAVGLPLEGDSETIDDLEGRFTSTLRRHRRIRRGFAAASVGTVGALAVALAWPSLQQLPPPPVQQEVAPGIVLADDMRVTVDPGGPGQGTPVGMWLTRDTVVAPDLRDSGFGLLEAKAGAMAVWLLYESAPQGESGEKQRVLLRVGPAASADMADTGLGEEAVALTWRQGDLAYRLSGRLPAEELAVLFESVRASLAPPVVQEALAETGPIASEIPADEAAPAASTVPAPAPATDSAGL
jgi:anti-sigma factor RsiW